MSYHHKTIFISLITTIIVFIFYSSYMYAKYITGQLEGPDANTLVGVSVFYLIGASIVVTIIVHILYAIIHAIITKKEPDEDTTMDERDKLIDLKGLHTFVIVLAFGFIGSMGALALGIESQYVFLKIIVSMFLANVGSEITKLYYYHIGV